MITIHILYGGKGVFWAKGVVSGSDCSQTVRICLGHRVRKVGSSPFQIFTAFFAIVVSR